MIGRDFEPFQSIPSRRLLFMDKGTQPETANTFTATTVKRMRGGPSMTAAPTRKRILSGVQPSGKLHLGNYFGAVRQHIALQDEGDCFYFIADYHSMTTVADADQRRQLVRDVALDYLALGLDPAKATFYRQSDVPEVTELAWMLGSVTNTGLLERAHSYKDKVGKGIEPRVGLFTYPVLIAAAVLIYPSHLLPVA